jgi:predicted hydrocarbon binding protein
MHGIILSELKKYADARLGAAAWARLVADAGLPPTIYLASREYADEDAARLVAAAARQLKKGSDEVLEDFGAFMTPDLMRMYTLLMSSRWKTLDVLENVESTIHRVAHAGASRPEIAVSRAGKHEAVVTYRSGRKMCSVAKGIIRGLGEHYREDVTVQEQECMQRGAEACVLRVQVAQRA